MRHAFLAFTLAACAPGMSEDQAAAVTRAHMAAADRSADAAAINALARHNAGLRAQAVGMAYGIAQRLTACQAADVRLAGYRARERALAYHWRLLRSGAPEADILEAEARRIVEGTPPSAAWCARAPETLRTLEVTLRDAGV